MRFLAEFFRRLGFLLHRRRFQREMEEELRLHVEQRESQLRAEGADPAAARSAALRRTGNLASLAARSRQAWGFGWLDRLAQDLRFALRGLGRNRLFSTVVILTFACGIGVNTAIFSAVYALLLNPYPYPQSNRIVHLDSRHISGKNSGAGWQDFLDWRQQSSSFDSLAIVPWTGNFTLTGMGEPESITGAATTRDFLRVLGIQPVLGRFFSAGEVVPNAPPVAVLSYAAWRDRFGLAPDVLGRTLMLNGRPFTVIGVLPRNFVFPGVETSEFLTAIRESSSGSRMQHQFDIVARLKDGVTLEQAQAEMTAIARRTELANPATNAGWIVRVEPLRQMLMADVRTPLLILSSAVGFVLLLASVTVAGLLLARVSARAKEVAIRASLGASRLRILRQMLTESFLLALAGGAAGILLAVWLMRILRASAPAEFALDSTMHLNPAVLAFTLAASLVTGFFSGLLPAWHISGLDPSHVLKAGADAFGRTRSRRRFLFWLVAAEAALSVLLMASAGLMAKSFLHAMHADTGMKTDHLLTFSLRIPSGRYGTNEQLAAFSATLLDRLRALPGVDSAAAVNFLPMAGGYTGGAFELPGQSAPGVSNMGAGWIDTLVQYTTVSPGYFRSLGIPLLRGRDFDQTDLAGSLQVGIVNETLARQFFPGQDPIGRRYKDTYDDQWRTIVGVVASSRTSLPTKEPVPGVYKPLAQAPTGRIWFVLRTRSSNPIALTATVRAAVRGLDSQIPVLKLRAMDAVVSDSMTMPRLLAAFLTAFAAFALLLSAIGIYGIVDLSSRQRTREMGIRLALGASYSSVVGLVVRTGLVPVALGAAAGIPAALALAGLLRSQLYGTAPRDATVFLLVPALLVLVAFLASFLPARRTAKLNAVAALRCE